MCGNGEAGSPPGRKNALLSRFTPILQYDANANVTKETLSGAFFAFFGKKPQRILKKTEAGPADTPAGDRFPRPAQSGGTGKTN